jgi:hypothetical protein
MATKAQVEDYALEYDITVSVPESLVSRANAWVAKLVGSQILDAQQRTYGEAAYALHLFAHRPTTLQGAYEKDIKSVSVGGISTTFDDVATSAENWLELAYGHLASAGFETMPLAGTYR